MTNSESWPVDDCYRLAERGYMHVGDAALEYIRDDDRALVSRVITANPECCLDPRFGIGADITEYIN